MKVVTKFYPKSLHIPDVITDGTSAVDPSRFINNGFRTFVVNGVTYSVPVGQITSIQQTVVTE